MSTFKWLASLVLAAIMVPTIPAETRCPGNAASITPRFVERALIVIPVMVNGAGPFDFIVDTGSQVTMIDPALASELHLRLEGTVGVISVAGYTKGSVTVLDTLEANSRVLEKPVAIVDGLGPIQAADARIRGVLGENVLSHFDVFIDYAHKLLCLDQTRRMRDSVRGERIPMETPQHPETELPFMERLVIAAHLSGTGTRQILLQVDSGIDGPMLYARDEQRVLPLLKRATPREGDLTEAQTAFAVLPLQEVRIGKRTLSHVMFVTPVRAPKNAPQPDEDGLFPTLLFQRVFICGADHYVVFDPK
jgi:hypothetical protein